MTAIDTDVTKFQIGDAVAVGTIVDSCGQCSSYQCQLEQYCLEGVTTTYAGIDRHDASIGGGYFNGYVVDAKLADAKALGADEAILSADEAHMAKSFPLRFHSRYCVISSSP